MRYSLPTQFAREHPVIRKEYAIYTPPVDEMISTIGDWIDQQRSGGYIYGPSRFGKSRGVKWFVRSVLEERFNTALPLVVWSHVPDIHSSEAVFWHELLLAGNFEFENFSRIRRKTDGRQLFIERLVSLARSCRNNFIVLIIDEAQDILLKEWKWLIGLQNALDLRGYRLSVFSIGSHQLGYQHTFTSRTGNAHISARFFSAHKRFKGIANEEDVNFVFVGYDRESEWPKGSRRTFLEYFAGEDYKRGCRLANCTSDVWAAMNEICPTLKADEREYPMENLVTAIEQVLFLLASGTDWTEATSKAQWHTFLSDFGLERRMKTITTPV